MRLTMGFDLLHRRIEEWSEEAQIEPDVSRTAVEGFREYGSDLVAFLHNVGEELELSREELVLAGNDTPSGELCEEMTDFLLDEWNRLDFGERPAGMDLDELPEVMESVAEVLEAEPAEASMQIEEAVELMDDFVGPTW